MEKITYKCVNYNILLTIIYLLSQGLLLIISGKWWDDWCHVGLSIDEFYSWIMQMGRPDLGWVYYLYNFTPEYTYRIITFILFYISVFCFSYIVKKTVNIDGKNRFFICALYASFPVNDARVVFSTFPYTVGYFFFMIAFTHFVYMLSNKKRNVWQRAINIVTFFLSFTLNSNLVYYVIVIFVIWRYKKHDIRKYVDYLIIPFLFFGLKAALYPTYGAYEGYNSITISSIVKAVVYIIPADIYVIKSVFVNYLDISKNLFIFIGVSVLIAFAWKEKQFSSREKDDEDYITRRALSCGIFALSIGLFAYVVARKSMFIDIAGVGGRDAILVAPGGTLIVYSLIRLMWPKKIIPYVVAFFVLCGMVSFNERYLEYEMEYYKQVGFSCQLKANEDIRYKKDIVYISDNKTNLGVDDSFYSLNSIAKLAYGDEKRFIRDISKQKKLKAQEIYSFVSNPIYHMSDYDVSNTNIDAVLFYSFDTSFKDIALLRYYEVADYGKFLAKINKVSSVLVVDDKDSINVFMNHE